MLYRSSGGLGVCGWVGGCKMVLGLVICGWFALNCALVAVCSLWV